MPFILIGLVTSILFLVISALAGIPTYRFNAIGMIPLLWLPYLLRRLLHLHPVHFALYAIALLFHDLGAFGLYQRTDLGLSYDIYVHFYFAFAVSFLLHRALRHNLPLGPWATRAGTVLMMMGFGALHEIMEYLSYLLLGEKNGMLKPSTSSFFDTQRDLLNNLLGTLLALSVIGVIRAVHERKANPSTRQRSAMTRLDRELPSAAVKSSM